MDASAWVKLDAAGVRRGRAWVLTRCSLTLSGGEALWISGDNGAGKSTLLAAMCGQRPLSAGSLRLFGEPGPPWPPAVRRRVGLLRHAHMLYEGFCAADNLLWMATLAGLSRPAARHAAARALAQVGLAGLGAMPLSRFSQGMQRRLALARVFLWPRQVLLVDEPSVALDAGAAAEVRAILAAHVAGGGALAFTSHDPAWAMPLASRRLHLAGGVGRAGAAGGGP